MLRGKHVVQVVSDNTNVNQTASTLLKAKRPTYVGMVVLPTLLI
jgi:hypothetical protein